jgi:hypothetical protein
VSEKKTQDTVFQNVDIVYFKQQSGIEKYNIFKDGTFLSWSSTSIMHTASSYLLRTVPRARLLDGVTTCFTTVIPGRLVVHPRPPSASHSRLCSWASLSC